MFAGPLFYLHTLSRIKAWIINQTQLSPECYCKSKPKLHGWFAAPSLKLGMVMTCTSHGYANVASYPSLIDILVSLILFSKSGTQANTNITIRPSHDRLIFKMRPQISGKKTFILKRGSGRLHDFDIVLPEYDITHAGRTPWRNTHSTSHEYAARWFSVIFLSVIVNSCDQFTPNLRIRLTLGQSRDCHSASEIILSWACLNIWLQLIRWLISGLETGINSPTITCQPRSANHGLCISLETT